VAGPLDPDPYADGLSDDASLSDPDPHADGLSDDASLGSSHRGSASPLPTEFGAADDISVAGPLDPDPYASLDDANDGASDAASDDSDSARYTTAAANSDDDLFGPETTGTPGDDIDAPHAANAMTDEATPPPGAAASLPRPLSAAEITFGAAVARVAFAARATTTTPRALLRALQRELDASAHPATPPAPPPAGDPPTDTSGDPPTDTSGDPLTTSPPALSSGHTRPT
jgi:hypothetical protein